MNHLSSLITSFIKSEFSLNVDPELTVPDPQFGDFSTNIAMRLAGQLSRPPQELATLITTELTSQGFQATTAGPGFINITLPDSYFIQELDQILADDAYGASAIYQDQVVVTEFSDPNPFKTLHIGHLYTSIVGDAISNLIESAGGTTHRVNFGGDVGLHVAKAMYGIIRQFDGEFPDQLANIPEDQRADWISVRYIEGNRAYEDDESARAEITQYNQRVYQLHRDSDHSSAFAQIYWTCRQWSYDYFDQFYASIGVKFDRYYPESATTELGLQTVREQQARGVYTESNGAIVFDGEPYGLHTRVFINSTGLPTYETKDLGLALTKWDDYHFDKSVIITGNDIIEYMKVLLKSIEQFRPDLVEKTLHLTHGMVKLAGGVKQSSRLGNFVKAVDAISITEEALRSQQDSADPSVVLAAIKYAFLRSSIGPDVVFDPATSVSLHGNSGPYLQYSLIRARSILSRRPEFNQSSVATLATDLDLYERSLIKKLSDFPSVITKSTTDLAPHTLCTYLYELAQTFNRFYENSRVTDDPRESLRLSLVSAYTRLLERGLSLLGINIPSRM